MDKSVAGSRLLWGSPRKLGPRQNSPPTEAVLPKGVTVIHRKNQNLLTASWLFVLFVLIYLSTAKGVFEYEDDVSMFYVTQDIVLHGNFSTPPKTPGATQGVDGHWYSKYGIGESILGVPFYFIGNILEKVLPSKEIIDQRGFLRANTLVYTVCLVGILCTAGVISLVYLVARELECSPRGAIVTAFCFGLGTFAWHYSRTFMSEPPSMLTGAISFYGMLRYRNQGRIRWLFLSGSAGGVCLLMRLTNISVIAPVGAWLLWLLFTKKRDTPLGMLRNVVTWVLPIAVALVMAGIYDLTRFGNVFETGYGLEAGQFTTPLYVGIYGLVLSPGKSVFLYAPVLLIGLAGWKALYHRSTDATIVAAGIAIVYMAFYARYYQWYGGGAWGPRFLTVILPFMAIPIAAFADKEMNVPKWIIFGGIGLLSLFIQVVSVLVPYVPYEGKMESNPILFASLLWNPAASPIIAESASFVARQYPVDLSFTYYASPALQTFQITSLIAAGFVFAVGMVVVGRRSQLEQRLVKEIDECAAPDLLPR